MDRLVCVLVEGSRREWVPFSLVRYVRIEHKAARKKFPWVVTVWVESSVEDGGRLARYEGGFVDEVDALAFVSAISGGLDA